MPAIILERVFEKVQIAGDSLPTPWLSFHKGGATQLLTFQLGRRSIDVMVDGVTIHQINNSASFTMEVNRNNIRGYNTAGADPHIKIECVSKVRWVHIWKAIESKLEDYPSVSFKLWKPKYPPPLFPSGSSALATSRIVTNSNPASQPPASTPPGIYLSLPSPPGASSVRSDHTESDRIDDSDTEYYDAEEEDKGEDKDKDDVDPILPFPNLIIEGVGEVYRTNNRNEDYFFAAEGSDGPDELSLSSDGFGDEFELLRQQKADGTGWILCIEKIG
ncbi:hypothetical protein TWF281_005871 [Arthrobotrys megalospora]